MAARALYATLSQPISALKMDPHIDKDSFHRTATYGESHRILTSPSQMAFPQISQQNVIFLLPPHFFFIRTLESPSKR